MGNSFGKSKGKKGKDAGDAKGGRTQSLDSITDKGPKVGMNDFDIIKVLGRGAFGKVMLVKKKADTSNTLFALKSLKKAEVWFLYQYPQELELLIILLNLMVQR